MRSRFSRASSEKESVSGSQWGTHSYGGSNSAWGSEESTPFAGLLGDVFQALDRLERRSEEVESRKSNNGISVWQLYLVDSPTCFGPCIPLFVLLTARRVAQVAPCTRLSSFRFRVLMSADT